MVAGPLARIEPALASACAQAITAATPPGLAAAIRHAVFPGGARLRPSLCLAVATACGDDAPDLADAAACAVELLHCASLVHDDLPCFDDAPLRRGRPSVHAAFGVPLAVLAGDALIVQAFATLASAATAHPARAATLIAALTGAVGAAGGIVAGQAWESESEVPREAYQRAKTGALFAGATRCGAIAAGVDDAAWALVGERLGLAYQVADDLRDVAGDAARCGKPVGRDAVLGRPNAVLELGSTGARARLAELVEAAADTVPPCPGRERMRTLIRAQAARFAAAQAAPLAA
jgi:geranylgeranyl diphosphate synthase type II